MNLFLFWVRKKYRSFIAEPIKRVFFIIVLIYILSALYSLCFQSRLILIKPLLDSHITQEEALRLILKLALGVFALSTAVAIFGFFVEYLKQVFILKTMAKVRLNLFKEILNIDYVFFTNKKIGDFLNNINVDLAYVRCIYEFLLGDFAKIIFTILASFFVALYICPQLAVIFFVGAPIVYYLIYKLTKRVKKRRIQALESFSNILESFSESLCNLKVIKLFNLTKYRVDNFSKENLEYTRMEKKLGKTKAISRASIEFLYGVGFSIIFIIAGYLLANKLFNLTIGGFTVFLINLVTLNKPIKALLDAYQILVESYVSLERISNIYDYPKDIKDTGKSLRDIETIKLKNVGYRYDENFVLKNIDVEIKKGDIIWIKGPSGVGKTTLLDIICGFLKITEGTVLINDENIENINKESLKSFITLIPNDTILFNTTINENILCVVPTASDYELKNAINNSFVSEFVDRIPEGLSFQVGPLGSRLSSGQRQRIALARAFLKNSRVIILDEPFSNLDTVSESLIQKALQKLSPEKIVIIASHKEPTHLNITKIVELKDGKIHSIKALHPLSESVV